MSEAESLTGSSGGSEGGEGGGGGGGVGVWVCGWWQWGHHFGFPLAPVCSKKAAKR